MIAADNMIEPASSHAEVVAYRHAVRANPQTQSIPLLLGQGIELSRFAGGLPAWLV